MKNTYWRWQKSGFSLMEIVVAMGIAGIAISIFGLVISEFQKSMTNINSEVEILDAVQGLQRSLAGKYSCEQAFRTAADELVVYSPPNATDPYEINVDRFYFARSMMFSTNSSQSTMTSHVLSIDSMKLVGVKGLEFNEMIKKTDQSLLGVKNFFVRFQIRGHFKKGMRTGQEFRYDVPMSISVNEVGSTVESCGAEIVPSKSFATAVRAGVNIQNKNCGDDVTRTDPGINGFAGASCTGGDDDGDGLCDDDITRTPTTNPNPLTFYGVVGSPWEGDLGGLFLIWSVRPTAADPYRHPLFTSVFGAAPVTSSAPEKRCLVRMTANTTNDDPNDIFRLCNDCFGSGNWDGIGCNNTKGWFLESCSGGRRGVQSGGDLYKTTITFGTQTDEYCVSQGFSSPHGDPFSSLWKSWLSVSTTIEVTCVKLR